MSHRQHLSILLFRCVVYNEQPAVYSESQKAFLKFTENTSKTHINVCLSKTNFSGKVFTFSPSLPSPTASVLGSDPPPPSFRASHWQRAPMPLAQQPKAFISACFLTHLSDVRGRGAVCVSCWWRDEKRNEAQPPAGKEKAIPGSGTGIWEAKHPLLEHC